MLVTWLSFPDHLLSYLSGSKKYTANVELGYETTTLDSEGNITRTASFDHVSVHDLESKLTEFIGTISQVPPLFSAISKNGKKLYESAREGVSVDDVEIESREVQIHSLKLVSPDKVELPQFQIKVECGGGTYIRSLVRDLGQSLDTAANMVGLERTQQGQFTLSDCLCREDWSVDNIYAAIDEFNASRREK